MKEKLDDPGFWVTLHGWIVAFWATQIPISVALSLLASQLVLVIYLVLISVLTALISQVAAWQAARTEVRQMQMMEGGTPE